MESFQQTNTVTTFLSSATKLDGGLMILALLIFAKSLRHLKIVKNLNYQMLNMVTGNVLMETKKVHQKELFAHSIATEETLFTTPTNAHLMVIGSNDMVVASASANQVATQTKNAVKVILLTNTTKITMNSVFHALTNVKRNLAVKRIFHQFKETEAGDALGSKMAKEKENMLVSLCAAKTRPNKSCPAELTTKVNVSGEEMSTVFANVKNIVTWMI
jgi:signal transduction histidine kinase